MRIYGLLFLLLLNGSLYAKEWKSMRVYQKTIQQETLLPSDWLRSDRVHNTAVWQQANLYNLNNNLPQEYIRIVERRDFYKWFYKELYKQGHEVVWVTMSYFISKKLHLVESFPYSIGFKKKTIYHVRQGSEDVFNSAFIELKTIFNLEDVLLGNDALEWDKTILFKEQFEWINGIYKDMDARSLKTVERIAKGECLYRLVVPKKIRFKGDISNPEVRYNYAVQVLREYCGDRYK
jgi:hypothetical protein